jgi:hypothetical protein
MCIPAGVLKGEVINLVNIYREDVIKELASAPRNKG